MWSPDGTRIVFGSGAPREGLPEKALLLQAPVNETAASEILLEAADTPARPCGPRQCLITPSDWSSDGRFVLYTFSGSFPATSDIWALPISGDRQPFPVANTRFGESLGTFSPDGRWIAYVSDETGQPNVYVQPFLRAGGKQRISVNGGRNPHWSGNGKELFYLDADGAMTAVSITTADTVTVGLPETLFPVATLSVNQMFSVTRDGQRFLVNARPPNTASVSPLTVIINWTSTLGELTRKPSRRLPASGFRLPEKTDLTRAGAPRSGRGATLVPPAPSRRRCRRRPRSRDRSRTTTTAARSGSR